VTTGIASRAEMTQLAAALKAYADRPDTMMSFPQIFQAWGLRHEPPRAIRPRAPGQ
jgi:hypothetical protein